MPDKNDKDWEEMGMSPIWDFKERGKEELVGVYMGKQEGVGENNSTIYDVELKSGERYSFWGNTVLDIRLRNLMIGEEIRVVYKGLKQSEKTNRTYKDFSVYHRKRGDEQPSDPGTN